MRPARNERQASSAPSGSAAITRIPGLSDAAAMAVPLRSPPPPTGDQDSVEVRDLFEQLQGRRALAGDDPVVVVGMDDLGAGFRNDAGQGRFPGLQRGFAVRDAPAIAGHGGFFDRGRVVGHDDVGRDPAEAGGQGQGLGMVARGMGGHAAGGRLLGKGKDGVGGAPEFEGPDLLEIFALQEDRRAQPVVERGAGQDGRPVGVGRDARRRRPGCRPEWGGGPLSLPLPGRGAHEGLDLGDGPGQARGQVFAAVLGDDDRVLDPHAEVLPGKTA